MNMSDIKPQVTRAVQQEWADFEKSHPGLARVIDQPLLIEHIADSLTEDEEFLDAYQTAQEASILSQVIGDIVLRGVRSILKKI